MSNDFFLTGVFAAISVFFLVLSFLVYSGKFKAWWVQRSNPVAPTGIMYVTLPSFLIFFLLCIMSILPLAPETRGNISLYLIAPLLLITIGLATWQPRWLKPKWLQWLEANHGDILRLLWEDARRKGKLEWQRQVRTQDGLEQWVAEVRDKHQLDKVDQRFIGDPHAD